MAAARSRVYAGICRRDRLTSKECPFWFVSLFCGHVYFSLFNIYINDLPGVPKESNLESYVDDSKIYLAFSIRDAELAAMKLTKDMRRITAWCCLNSLLVNPEKTKMLILGTRQMLEQVPETILGENITPVAVAKDLGMILDSCLSYDEHIASVVSSCIAGLGQISRVKHIFDRKTLILIINSLIFSKMYYCSAVWSNTSQRNIEKLQAVQNFAARRPWAVVRKSA